MAWHRLEHARSRVSELDRQESTKLEKSYIVETWTGSRVSMCQDSSRLRRDRPFFSSSSSNKTSSSSRVSSNSRELDLPSSSHQPPLSCDPNPSPLHCLIHLVFQTCKMSFKRRNDSGGEASASSVRISLLLIFPTFLLQGEAESKAGGCSLV